MNEAVRCPICHLRIPPYGRGVRMMWEGIIIYYTQGDSTEGYCAGHAPQVVPKRRMRVPDVFQAAFGDEELVL